MRAKRTQYAGTTSRRRRIIEAALDCFVEMGFTDTTMEDIRERSASSNGSIYHHFKSKEQLAAAVYLEGITDYQNGLAEQLEAQQDPRKGIFEIVRYHLNWVHQNPSWAQYLFTMRHADFMRTSEDSISQSNTEFSNTLGEWFVRHIRGGKMRRLPRAIYLALIWGPCQEFSKHWLAGDRNTDALDAAAEVIAGAAWGALRTK
jgi:AcrR family transcriptional regulator